jgi:hypothetical protein
MYKKWDFYVTYNYFYFGGEVYDYKKKSVFPIFIFALACEVKVYPHNTAVRVDLTVTCFFTIFAELVRKGAERGRLLLKGGGRCGKGA